jgi:hypothetical protein
VAESNIPLTDEAESSSGTNAPVTERPSRGPDVLTLLMGLISLSAAGMALFNWAPALPLLDPRWLLAGGAVLVGLLLLVASVRPTRGNKRAR